MGGLKRILLAPFVGFLVMFTLVSLFPFIPTFVVLFIGLITMAIINAVVV
jgi:hypothetical protein